MARTDRRNTPLGYFVFVLYCGFLLWLLLGRTGNWTPGIPYQEQLWRSANLIPFFTIRNYLYVLRNSGDTCLITHCFLNLTGNILLFIPPGWLLPELWPRQRNYLRFFVCCLGAVFFVEVLQLFALLGSFDVDDIFLNLLGLTIGFLCHVLFPGK